MPFLDWLELAAVSGIAEVTAHRALRRLRRDGLVGHVRHASRPDCPHPPLVRHCRRPALPGPRGRDRTGTPVAHPLGDRPLAAGPAGAAGRGGRHLPAGGNGGGRRGLLPQVPVVPQRSPGRRHGPGRRKDPGRNPARGHRRPDRLLRPGRAGSWTPTCPGPGLSWRCCPTNRGCCKTRRLLARYPGPVYLATEQDVVRSLADDPIWHIPSASTLLSVREILAHLRVRRWADVGTAAFQGCFAPGIGDSR